MAGRAADARNGPADSSKDEDPGSATANGMDSQQQQQQQQKEPPEPSANGPSAAGNGNHSDPVAPEPKLASYYSGKPGVQAYEPVAGGFTDNLQPGFGYPHGYGFGSESGYPGYPQYSQAAMMRGPVAAPVATKPASYMNIQQQQHRPPVGLSYPATMHGGQYPPASRYPTPTLNQLLQPGGPPIHRYPYGEYHHHHPHQQQQQQHHQHHNSSQPPAWSVQHQLRSYSPAAAAFKPSQQHQPSNIQVSRTNSSQSQTKNLKLPSYNIAGQEICISTIESCVHRVGEGRGQKKSRAFVYDFISRRKYNIIYLCILEPVTSRRRVGCGRR